MTLKCITASILALGIAGTTAAQQVTVDTAVIRADGKPFKKERSIILKKGDKEKKMTIVVDGDHVTINGKDVKGLGDSDALFLHGPEGLARLAPGLKEKLRMGSLLPGNDFNFSFSSNSAVLGVMSEKNEKGAKLTEVTKESAATSAGLQKDDIITMVGDTKIGDPEDLYKAIGKYKPEDKVTISYLRDGKEHNTTATLGKNKVVTTRYFRFNDDMDRNFNFNMPMVPGIRGMALMSRPRLGMQVQDLENTKGVKVLDVAESTPAAKAGLKKDDVITGIDGKEVKSVDELKEKLRGLKEGDNLKVTYQRNGKTQTAELTLPKKLKTADL